MSEEGRGYRIYKRVGLAAGVLVFAAIELAARGMDPPARHAAAMTALMVVWWMTEALPIHITALVPLVVVPVTALMKFRPVGKETWLIRRFFDLTGPDRGGDFVYQFVRAVDPFLHAYIFLFLGGMCIAAAMQKWNLHRRIALHIIRIIGGGPKRIILGFIVATAFISMWISNTATAVMMVPIGLAVIRQMEAADKKTMRLRHFGLAVMLAIAYAANVGGIGTKIGTAPNLIFCDAAGKLDAPFARELGFLDYLKVGLPFIVIFLPLVWLVLCRIASRDRIKATSGLTAVRVEIRKLGPMSRQEKFVLFCFVLVAALWICGEPLAGLLRSGTKHADSISAMFVTLLLLVVPLGKGTRGLDWPAIRRIPWSVLLLLGGSFAMASAVGGSGLDTVMAKALSHLREWTPVLAFVGVAFVSVFVSAVASNTATTTMMLNLLRGAFAGPLAVPIMGTSAIAASCDFMLPAGTPPNAIVFGSGYVSVPRMMRTGFVLDLAAALAAGLWGYLGVRLILAA